MEPYDDGTGGGGLVKIQDSFHMNTVMYYDLNVCIIIYLHIMTL